MSNTADVTKMTVEALPVDIWLLVFALIDDDCFLWSACRNVSTWLRACVDEFFRHGVMLNTLVDLYYSDIHTRPGPMHSYVHLPMAFDRFSDDGVRVVFKQRAYKLIDGVHLKGSLRGWVPFIERYYRETRQAPPAILNKSKPNTKTPMWETEHSKWRSRPDARGTYIYLLNLSNMTSIGQGDRPPFFIRVFDYVNDTELVHLVVDCKQREISFDWRQTCSLFYRELRFTGRATWEHPLIKYADRLGAFADRWLLPQFRGDRLLARRKRLLPWMEQNQKRVCPEMLLWSEQNVTKEKQSLRLFLRHDNLIPVDEEDSAESEEIVPEKLAVDHPELLWWPRASHPGRGKLATILSCGSRCVIL
jgi:hypothetical protein